MALVCVEKKEMDNTGGRTQVHLLKLGSAQRLALTQLGAGNISGGGFLLVCSRSVASFRKWLFIHQVAADKTAKTATSKKMSTKVRMIAANCGLLGAHSSHSFPTSRLNGDLFVGGRLTTKQLIGATSESQTKAEARAADDD